MKKIWALLVMILAVIIAPAYGKHEQLPLPQQVLVAKTIYIDNQSGLANLGDRAYDELRKWGRYQIVDSPDKADAVLLLSAKEYISGYTSNSYHNTTGKVDYDGSVTAHTYGYSGSYAVYSGDTHITLLDPKTGTSLWADSRAWGRWKSATRGLIKELRDRVKKQENGR